MATNASHTPGQQKGDAGTTFQGAKDKARGAAAAAVDTVKEAAGAAADKAREVASAAGRKAKDAASAVGESVESGGRYLQERDFSGMMDDFTDLVRRYPVPALLIGIGLGFCMGRVLRS